MQRLAKRRTRFRIGMRTLKTLLAVIIAMIVSQSSISPYSNLSLAMLGAVAAVQPSFKESLDSSWAQILGTITGGIVGNLLLLTPLPTIVITGIAVVVVITVYNLFHINYAPSLPILVVVILCTTPDVNHVTYALGRLWDTCIGLGVGLIINTVVFPYDNSRQIRFAMESLDKMLLRFLEDMFDGDDILPDADDMVSQVDAMERMLRIFSQQRLFRHLKTQRREVTMFRICENKAKALVARTQLLARMDSPGHLSQETYDRLIEAGADIRDLPHIGEFDERDIVINYHVKQILTLRRELLDALSREKRLEERK